MKVQDIIRKALEREKKGVRGLRITKPNISLAKAHMDKADHNLIVMSDLSKLKHTDWVIITAYYAMYHAATSLIMRLGLESKEHAATVAVLEYFFKDKLFLLLKKFDELKYKKDKIEQLNISEKYLNFFWKVKQTREKAQYGIFTSYRESELIMDYARQFVTKIKLVSEEVDENLIEQIIEEVKKL
ncbi:MAG: HEPN domain-containing protein [Candidatus Aenigmarchaeota archaeon]|nr:HEPN domain-containing protein [Candidatus Aenigmarchaeota archaeon]